MERLETELIDVHSFVSNLAKNMESTNTISINLHNVIEWITQEGRAIQLLRAPFSPSPHINLKPSSLTPSCISQLLDDHEVPHCDYIGEVIASDVARSLSKDPSLREPFFVSVNVKFVNEILLSPPPTTTSKRASRGVLKRLKEDHRVVKSMDLREDKKTCSICIENLWESSGHGNIIKMPECLHMFHQGCLFKWLGRQNSCPLCRRVPFV